MHGVVLAAAGLHEEGRNISWYGQTDREGGWRMW